MNPAQRIDSYLRGQGSPLAGHGASFVKYGRQYGVDPLLLVAISGAESGFGRNVKGGTYNPFGWGPHRPLGSWDNAIATVAKGLRSGYLDQGLKTINQIGAKWAPAGASNDPTNLNSNWARNVRRFYTELGGQGVSSKPSPAQAMPGQPVMPELGRAPDLSGAVLANLGTPRWQQRKDPLASLRNLTMAAASQPVSGAAPDPRMPPQRQPQLAAPQGGGGWAGSKAFGGQLVKGVGLKVTSTKRDRKNTASGGVSDHWTGSKNSFAWDLGGSVRQMDRSARQILGRLGVDWDGRSPVVVTRNIGGFRVQVLYRTNVGGNHFDHIHVGVKRL